MLAAFSDYFDLNRLIGMMPNSSEHGKEIDQMLNFCHWFMLILFVGWTSYFLYTLFRFHQSRHPKADYHGVRNHVSTHIEVSVVIIEAVILLGFALPLWGKRMDFPQDEKDHALKIRAIGYQFGWRLHYAGPDGKFGRQNTRFIKPGLNDLGIDPDDPDGKDDAVVTGDMHLVLARATVVRVSSLDVIHGFALHQMRIQQDAMPGTEAPQWFRPIQKGSWQIICAQLCGEGHSGMAATYSVEDKKDFDAWYTDQRELTQNKLKNFSEELKKKAEAEKAELEKHHGAHGAEHAEKKEH